MSKTYIQLARTGDIISLLPMLYALHQRGEKNKLMVGSEFASVLDGVSWIERVVFHGKATSLAEAVKDAGPDAVSTQVFGSPDDVKAHTFDRAGLNGSQTDSFVKEAWALAGHSDLWYSQPPLVFDRRDSVREEKLVKEHIQPKKRVVLVALGGKTSPFPYRELALKLLELEFGRRKGWQILDISNLKAERIYDLLALYERAHCLIASDSAPLHLAVACPNLPVVALVNDQPNYWHGSPWRPNHIWHCRYGDFPKRCTDMLGVIEYASKSTFQVAYPNLDNQIVHVVNASETTKENALSGLKAIETWAQQKTMCFTRIDPGALGKDSLTHLNDSERHPFLRGCLRLGLMRTKAGDRMCLTRTTTCFREGITERLMANEACYAHRVQGEPALHNPATDLFCATREWWEKHFMEIPDLVWGRDQIWASVLQMMFRKHGAVELVNAVYKH